MKIVNPQVESLKPPNDLRYQQFCCTVFHAQPTPRFVPRQSADVIMLCDQLTNKLSN